MCCGVSMLHPRITMKHMVKDSNLFSPDYTSHNLVEVAIDLGTLEHLSSPKRSWETTIFQPTQDVTW